MIGFFVVALIIVVFVIRSGLIRKIDRLQQHLSDADDKIRILTNRVTVLEATEKRENNPELKSSPAPEEFNLAATNAYMSRFEFSSTPSSVHQSNKDQNEPTFSSEMPSHSSKITGPPDQAIPSFWQKMEKQITENWTGIVGTIVLVLGIGFLGVYAALKMNEFFRFLMVVGCAVGMGAVFFTLKNKEKWAKLALWMRSASGAVFLFACLGAGGIPGLHWIHNPVYGLIVLLLGIAVNLLLAVIGGKQIFASLHILLALTALTIAPQSESTLIIACVVTLSGIALTYREKWDYHLLLSISTFFGYHTFWYFKLGGKETLTGGQNILGIFLVSAVCIVAAVVHYRKLYGTRQFERVPFMVHLINWAYFGLGLLMHVSGEKWKTIPLFAGAIIAFLMANYARKLQNRWLHCTDTLIAQIVAVIGIISIAQWGMDYDSVMLILFLQVLAYTRVVVLVREEILFRVGIALSQVAWVTFVITLSTAGNLSNNLICIRQSALTAIGAAGILALHSYLANEKDRRLIMHDSLLSIFPTAPNEFSLSGLITGLLLICATIFAHQLLWLHFAVVTSAIILIFLREKVRTNGMTAGVALLTLALHVINWYVLYTNDSLSISEKLARGLPLFLVSLSTIRWDSLPYKRNHAKWFGIYLSVLHFVVLTHIVFKPISPLIPGVCWLLASLALLETASVISIRYKEKAVVVGEPERYLLHTSYALLIAFHIRHILVHLQSEEYIGPLKIRFLIEALALAVMFFWAFSKQSGRAKEYKSWIFLHPLFAEFIALFAILTISVEVAKHWHPIIWLACAFGTLIIGNKFTALSRMKAYSALFYWASIFQVTFLLGFYHKLGTHWYERDWLLGSVSIALQFVFLVVFHKFSSLSQVTFPSALAGMNKAVVKMYQHWNLLMFYPLLICVALFFYWTFAKSLLTLLFVLECFTVFVISIALREQHFRYAALIGLFMCIVRLIFFDLARSTTLVKALVFLGVGLLMLGMNILYSKFKERLLEEKSNEIV